MLGATLLLSTEAFIAKTDAVLAGTTTLAHGGAGRTLRRRRDGPPAGARDRGWLFWVALAAAILVKGPVGADGGAAWPWLRWRLPTARRPGWRSCDWYWGLILVAGRRRALGRRGHRRHRRRLLVAALAGDLAPKLAGGQESHGAPPGYHTLLTPILAFPMTLLLPAAAVAAWRYRARARRALRPRLADAHLARLRAAAHQARRTT